jgi:hypothetical protein
LYDDGGRFGGLGDDVRFIICGDYNADPQQGESVDHAILQLLENPVVDSSFTPQGAGGATNTSAFGLRVDYVLPSVAGLEILEGAIFWPTGGQEGADLISASDHRLVWMDLELKPLITDAVSELEIFIDGADVVLTWNSDAGIAYGIEGSRDLASWTAAVGAVVQIEAGVASYRDAGAASVPGRKFYRITAEFSE